MTAAHLVPLRRAPALAAGRAAGLQHLSTDGRVRLPQRRREVRGEDPRRSGEIRGRSARLQQSRRPRQLRRVVPRLRRDQNGDQREIELGASSERDQGPTRARSRACERTPRSIAIGRCHAERQKAGALLAAASMSAAMRKPSRAAAAWQPQGGAGCQMWSRGGSEGAAGVGSLAGVRRVGSVSAVDYTAEVLPVSWWRWGWSWESEGGGGLVRGVTQLAQRAHVDPRRGEARRERGGAQQRRLA